MNDGEAWYLCEDAPPFGNDGWENVPVVVVDCADYGDGHAPRM